MNDNVLCFCTEQPRRAAARCNDAVRTDQCSREFWREVRVNIIVTSGSATAQEPMPFRENTCAKGCLKPDRRWMELGVGAIIPESISAIST